jgi:hypothetical protein
MLLTGMMLAQPVLAQLPSGPPPSGSGGPQSTQSLRPPGPQGDRPETQLPRQNRLRGLRLSAIDYFDFSETTPMWTIDSPVTGFGNEALWEEMDPNFAPARVARVSTAKVASR